MKHPSKGITLVELAVIVLIICGLTIASIPPFFFLRDYSREKKMRDLVAHLQSNLPLPYPQILDDNPVNAICTQCFNTILKRGLESDLWFKKDTTTYLFFKRGYQQEKKEDYQINYNPQDGKMVLFNQR